MRTHRGFQSVAAAAMGLALLLLLALALVACGEEQTSEEARQQLVTDLDAFKATITNMEGVSATTTVDELKAKRDEAQAAWDKVVESAANVKEAEIGQVQTAWDDLAASIDDLSGDTTLAQALPALAGEISALKAAYDDLYNGLK